MKESPFLLPGVILLTGIMVSAALLFRTTAPQTPVPLQQPQPTQTLDERVPSSTSPDRTTSPTATTTPPQTGSPSAQQTRCTESGGTYKNARCTCPTDYTLSAGECVDAFGLQGGRTGAQVKAQQTTVLKKGECEYSGGTMAGSVCRCPADYTLDPQGICTDAFGLPGGQQGRDQQAAHPLN